MSTNGNMDNDGDLRAQALTKLMLECNPHFHDDHFDLSDVKLLSIHDTVINLNNNQRYDDALRLCIENLAQRSVTKSDISILEIQADKAAKGLYTSGLSLLNDKSYISALAMFKKLFSMLSSTKMEDMMSSCRYAIITTYTRRACAYIRQEIVQWPSLTARDASFLGMMMMITFKYFFIC